jgi:hypothetical protein
VVGQLNSDDMFRVSAVVEGALAESVAELGFLAKQGRLNELTGSCVIRRRRGAVVIIGATVDQVIDVRIGPARYGFPESARHALDIVAQANGVKISDIPGAVDSAAVMGCIRQMVLAGALDVFDPAGAPFEGQQSAVIGLGGSWE